MALACVGAAVFLARGPVRAVRSGSGDLAAPFAATRAYWQQSNPYDQAALRVIFDTQPHGADVQQALTFSLYPPHTFAVLAPLLAFSWPQSKWLMVLLNTGLPCLALVLVARRRWAGEHGVASRRAGALVLLFCAPLQTGIALGQLGVLAISLAFLSLELAERGHARQAGVLLALGLMLKPHAVILIPLYALLRRWWSMLATCVAVGLSVTVFVVAWWWRVAWRSFLDTALGNWRFETISGMCNIRGPFYWQRIDLAPLAMDCASILAAVLGVFLLSALVRSRRRAVPGAEDPLAMACICLFMVIAVYHRYYDAFVLVIPALYLCGRELPRPVLMALGLAALPFLLPVAPLLHVLGVSHAGVRSLVDMPVVGRLLMLHANATLLLAFLACTWILWRNGRARNLTA